MSDVKPQFKKLHHCVYALQYHLVVVTKYRRRCLSAGMLDELRAICAQQIAMKEGSLLEFEGEANRSPRV
jgi:putative transposase